MTAFTIYRLADGEICITGNTHDPATVVPPDGAALLLDNTTDPPTYPAGEPSSHYVAGGVLQAYTPAQAAAKAAKPDTPAAWSNQTFQWTDTRSLDQARLDQWARVKAGRDATIFSSFTWGGSPFDANDDSQQRIQGAVQLALLAKGANQSYSVDWTLADNTVRTLSGDDMIAVGLALGGFVQANFVRGQALRSQIQAAADLASVAAVVWTPA